jgi:hypothetical protein
MKWIFVLLCLSTVLLTTCEKEEEEQYSQDIMGEWDWIFSCGCLGCISKAQVSYTQKLEFTADSVYYRYHNDSVIHSGVFHLYQQEDSQSGQKVYYLQFGDARLCEYDIHNDTLGIEIFPRSGSVYKRIR